MSDEIHRAALAASIPPTIRWLDAEAVGAMLGYSARHVLQRIACRPDFPSPRNLGGLALGVERGRLAHASAHDFHAPSA